MNLFFIYNMSNNNIYEISYTKQIIIKTLLYKYYNKIYIIDIIYCKLYTSVPNSNFYFSGLEGALIFLYNFEENNFYLILYDLNYYDLLFKIKINSNLITKNILIPLKNNFLILEITGGFLGFLFPNVEQGKKFIDIIKENDKNYIENYMNENNKILKNKNNKENIIKSLKNKFQRNLIDNNQLDINNDQYIYNNNLEEILNCLDYNLENNKFIFNGEKFLFDKFIRENNIPLDNIEFIENNSFTIENKKHFINILINHFVNDIKNQKKLKDLYKEYKLKKNNNTNKNFMEKRHLSTNIPKIKIENKLIEINSNEKSNSSKNIENNFKRLSVINFNTTNRIDKPKIDDIRFTLKSDMKIINEIDKDFHNFNDKIIPNEIENDEDEIKNPFFFPETKNESKIDLNNKEKSEKIKVPLFRKNNILTNEKNKNLENEYNDKETKLIKEISDINVEENNNGGVDENIKQLFDDNDNENNIFFQNQNVLNDKNDLNFYNINSTDINENEDQEHSFENDNNLYEKLEKVNQILKNSEIEKKNILNSQEENNERKEIKYLSNKIKTLIDYNKITVSENKENTNIDYLIKK